jgi:hypothetical protein
MPFYYLQMNFAHAMPFGALGAAAVSRFEKPAGCPVILMTAPPQAPSSQFARSLREYGDAQHRQQRHTNLLGLDRRVERSDKWPNSLGGFGNVIR